MKICPKVSIIIPCWNAEKLVSEAINSALQQHYANIEVIVIDDGSTDGSLAVIQSFAGLIRWETGPNRGACDARNRGLALATGELVQYLDADDLLHPEKLAKQVPIVLKNPNKIVFSARESYLLGSPDKKWIDAPQITDDPFIFALNKIIDTSGPIYQRKVICDIGGFRSELRCAQDYELQLRFSLRGWDFLSIKKVLITKRRREDSISSDSFRVVEQMRSIYWEAFKYLEKNGKLTGQRRLAIAARMGNAGRSLIKLGRCLEAQNAFQAASKIHPKGVRQAYNQPAWIMKCLLGARFTERLVGYKRELFNRSQRPR